MKATIILKCKNTPIKKDKGENFVFKETVFLYREKYKEEFWINLKKYKFNLIYKGKFFFNCGVKKQTKTTFKNILKHLSAKSIQKFIAEPQTLCKIFFLFSFKRLGCNYCF